MRDVPSRMPRIRQRVVESSSVIQTICRTTPLGGTRVPRSRLFPKITNFLRQCGLDVGDFAAAHMLRDDAKDSAGYFFGVDRHVIAKRLVDVGEKLFFVAF